jgi:hypothetical protein
MHVGGASSTNNVTSSSDPDEVLRLQLELEEKRQELVDKAQTIDRLVSVLSKIS